MSGLAALTVISMSLSERIEAAPGPPSAPTPDAAARPQFGPPRPTLPMTLAQHRAFRRLEFEMMDLNHDGLLTVDEFNARLIRELNIDDMARAGRGLRIACGNVGKTCDFARFQAQGDRDFARVDANSDGVVTAEELKAAGGSFHLEKP